MQFSNLTNQIPTQLNNLYSEYKKTKSEKKPIIDLINGDFFQSGIGFPAEHLRSILIESISHIKNYKPNPLGQYLTREVIAEYYRGFKINVSPDQILITPGTSCSYFYCLKLLVTPGQEILCPSPSYPLFETIAKICEVDLRYYLLRESQDWAIDLDYLENQITTKTGAIILISPHNPTGKITNLTQLNSLAEILKRHNLPIIADEVFSEYLFDLDNLPRPLLTDAPLVFTLNGLSKMFALPSLKLGWILVSGQNSLVKKSLNTLELIADTFLPVSDVVQRAVPRIFQEGSEYLVKNRDWVRTCCSIAEDVLSQSSVLKFAKPDGGFYLTINLKNFDINEEMMCIDLLKDLGILVHPGYFYDVKPAHLVLTFAIEHQQLEVTLEQFCKWLFKWKQERSYI